MEAKRSYFLTEAVLLSLATALLYVVGFAHEAGYLSFFRIPSQFVRPGTTTLILSFLACATAVLSAVKFLNFLTPLLRILVSGRYQKWNAVIILNIILLFPAVFVLAVYPFSWTLLIILSGVVVVFNVAYLGVPVLLSWVMKKKRPAHEVAEEAILGDDPLDLMQWVSKHGGREMLLWAVGVLALVGLAWVVGNSSAMKESGFYVVEDRKLILIRVYEDHLLCKPFNEEKKTFDKTFVLVPSGSHEIKFEWRDLGPMSLEKN